MKRIKRTLDWQVCRANFQFEVVLVTGMRGAGKKTMLTSLERVRIEMDLYNSDDYVAVCYDARKFFSGEMPVYVAELQRTPGLVFITPYWLNQLNKPVGQIWFSSTRRIQSNEFIEKALAGRYVSYQLLPFSIYESQGKAYEQRPYLPKKHLKRTLVGQTNAETWRRIWAGSWEGVLYESVEDRDKFFKDLVRTYIARDIVRAGIRHLNTFEHFLIALASRVGQELQINTLAPEVGISITTAEKWLALAEDTGIIYFLPAFPDKIVGKSIIKKPKLYFTDTGLAAWLCQVPSSEALQTSHNANHFFKNFVVLELLKSWLHNGKNPRFYHYRDTKCNTIDLLIKYGTKYLPINIEATENPQASMVQDFDLIKAVNVHRGQGALICLCEKQQFIASDVLAHSIWDI